VKGQEEHLSSSLFVFHSTKKQASSIKIHQTQTVKAPLAFTLSDLTLDSGRTHSQRQVGSGVVGGTFLPYNIQRVP
jgi:hypothetical protein